MIFKAFLLPSKRLSSVVAGEAGAPSTRTSPVALTLLAQTQNDLDERGPPKIRVKINTNPTSRQRITVLIGSNETS